MPDLATFECRICLEDMDTYMMMNTPCCGHEVCFPCFKQWFWKKKEYDLKNKPTNNTNCPNCRSPLPATGEGRVSLLRGHVSAGRSWAHYIFALMYKGGLAGVPQSDKEAFKHYLLAELGGDLRAICTVGECYRRGEGVSQSTAKAIEYHAKGSNAGVEGCSYSLGLLYSEEGPHQDYGKAVHYMKVAMHQRSQVGFHHFGMWYIEGKCGLPVDEAKGIALIIKAAESGYQNAQGYMGRCYYVGDGVEKSIPLALKYYKLALGEIKEKELSSSSAPLDDTIRNQIMFGIAACHLLQGPCQSLINSYYWFKKYLSTHPPSCKGCEGESIANDQLAFLKTYLVSLCTYCKKKKEAVSRLDKCSRCQAAHYCSKECQREDWGSHKEICKK